MKMITQTLFIQSTIPRLFRTRTKYRCQKRSVKQYPSCHNNNNSLLKLSANLVTPQWLGDNLSYVKILDARGRVVKLGTCNGNDDIQQVQYVSDYDSYVDDGHIPTAVHIDWRTVDLRKPFEMIDNMSELGIRYNERICIYDWGDMLFATRIWLLLTSIGCSDIHILNGGWNAWIKYEGNISYDTQCPLSLYDEFDKDEQSELKSLMMTIDLNQLKNIVLNRKETDTLIMDARSQKLYQGIAKRSKYGGHIPTAVNLPYRQLLHENGIGLKSDDQLKRILQNKLSEQSNIVCYCNGGVASSLLYFCLVRCAFHHKLHSIRNYCASFNEWGNLDDAPIHSLSKE